MNNITRKHIIRRGGIVLASVATLTGIASAYAVGTNNGAASATPVPEVTVTHRETIIREVPVEVAPAVEADEAPAAEVAAEATPAAAPATVAPTATPTRTAPATSAPATSAPAASGAVSRDRAIQLAINAAGGGRAVDVSQGSERGIPTWEILVRRNNGSQVEVYVARNNGNIVKVENANDW